MNILDKITIFLLVYGICKLIDTSIHIYNFIDDLKIKTRLNAYRNINSKKIKVKEKDL